MKARRIEIANLRLALLASILSNGLAQLPPESFDGLKVRNLARTELLGQREFRPGHEPVGEVIAF